MPHPDGFLALPPAGTGPGVLVLHAWWGLNETIKGVCTRLAAAGFVAFAPDLYHGPVAQTIAEAEELSGTVDTNYQQIKTEIAEAARFLHQRVAPSERGLAVIGFSLGAFFALALATGRHPVAASILRTFARFVDRGMLPNRFPDAGETPEYNTVDATLWYFEAMRAYLATTSLPHSPLTPAQQRGVVDVCARHLFTSYGLRSLAQNDPAYIGHYGGGPQQRDGAYHQGTVWSWLIGPFVSAHLRVHGDRAAVRAFLTPFAHHLTDHGLGSVSEIFDGDALHTPRGCFAQAWSVAELLRVWNESAGAE